MLQVTILHFAAGTSLPNKRTGAPVVTRMLFPDQKLNSQTNQLHKQFESDSASAGAPTARQQGAVQQEDVARPNSNRSRASFNLPIALKVAAFFMLPVLIGLSTLTYVMTDSHRNFQYEQIDNFGKLFTRQLASSATEPLFADVTLEMNVLVNQAISNDSILGAALFDHEYNPIVSAGMLPEQQLINFGMEKKVLGASLLAGAGHSDTLPLTEDVALYLKPVTFRGITGGYAAVVFEYSSLTGHFDQLARLLLGSTILLILSSGLIIFAISRRVLEPLTSMTEAVSSMRKGETAYIPERRNDELGQLIKSINNMGKDLARKSQVQSVLGKFMAADVADRIIDELDTVNFKGDHVNATVLFADIVGFTEMAEKMPPAEVSTLLNEYFSHYASCAKHYFGTVDKFIGDCVMIVFGASREDANHQYHALACARLMQKLTARINQDRREKGLFPVHLRIGVNSGDMLAGLLGSQDRMEYTVVGDAVNMASRLCNEAQQGQIIIQEEYYQSISGHHELEVDCEKTIKIRGKEQPVSIYNVTGISHLRRGIDESLIDDLLARSGYSGTH